MEKPHQQEGEGILSVHAPPGPRRLQDGAIGMRLPRQPRDEPLRRPEVSIMGGAVVCPQDLGIRRVPPRQLGQLVLQALLSGIGKGWVVL